jgi:hypothetical protein
MVEKADWETQNDSGIVPEPEIVVEQVREQQSRIDKPSS